MTPPELCPPHLPPEVFKDWLEEFPQYVGMQDAPTFDREAAYLRWLTESKTFERLGECMASALRNGSAPYGLPQEFWVWRNQQVGSKSNTQGNHKGYAAICESFGVPAVMVQVEEEMDGGILGMNPWWAPPSPALAAAVLRWACEFKELQDDFRIFCGYVQTWVLQDGLAPNGTAIRLRLGATGDWRTRPL